MQPSDRGYYDKMQYLWTYGDQDAVTALCTTLEHLEPRDLPQGSDSTQVTGWLGTVSEVEAPKG